MTKPRTALFRLPLLLTAALAFVIRAAVSAPPPPPPPDAPSTLVIDAGTPVGRVSPLHHGLMTEEINHSYDGGLYAELVRNRAFLDNKNAPEHWSVVQGGGDGAASAATIALDTNKPLNAAIPVSLRVDVTAASDSHEAGIANDGYWGFPVRPRTRYRASFYASAASGFSGHVTVSLQSDDGRTVYAKGRVDRLTADWRQYRVDLQTGRSVAPTTKARLVVTVDRPGTVWFSLVSLFPPTWNDRPNGLRKDLMQMLVDLRPKFLRFPGGNYLEGNTLDAWYDWKKTIGPLDQRPGHPSPWGYRSTDGMGLLEFLLWCEDMGAEPVLAVYAGYSLRGDYIPAGPALEPFVQEALQEIEYVTGDPVRTEWGRRRAADGHPRPFPLHYVEIGNEDFFDRSGSYDGRFAQFFDAIKARRPGLKVISSVGFEQPESKRVHSRAPDTVDEHYYRPAEGFVGTSPGFYDKYSRRGPEIFVGEWAAFEDPKIAPWSPGARNQPPTPSMTSAIGDAAFLAAMERNSDLVVMQCYAPMLVNVNPGGRQWRPDLIGYDALRSFGSPSYYTIRMFSQNLGDEILRVTPAPGSPVQSSATRDSRSGRIFVKLVNPQSTAASVTIALQNQNGSRLASTAEAITLAAADPDATNSIDDPEKVTPQTSKVRGIGAQFTYVVPPHGIVVLKLDPR